MAVKVGLRPIKCGEGEPVKLPDGRVLVRREHDAYPTALRTASILAFLEPGQAPVPPRAAAQGISRRNRHPS